MEDTCANDAINHLRETNREEISALRRHGREALLRQRRLSLCEVEALVTSITLEQFKEFVQKVKERTATVEVLKAIKNNCCTSARSEAFMKTEGALYSMIGMLVGKNSQLQLEAAACLTNLACGSHKAAQRTAKAAGPYFISFLGSSSFYLQDQSAWAAGNIANCCFQCFSLLKVQGLVPALLPNLISSVPDVIISTVFALNACTKYEDNDLRGLAEQSTINYLLKILHQTNLPHTCLSDTAFTLSNIFFLAAKNNIDITESSIESIITHLHHSVSEEINTLKVVPLIRCLGFMSLRDSACWYISQHQKFKEIVAHIFSSGRHSLVVEFLWVLTNISGYCDTATQCIDLNLIFEIIDIKNPNYSSIVHVLHFLCTYASKSGEVRELMRKQDLTSKIGPLSNCGEKTVEKGAEVLLDMLR